MNKKSIQIVTLGCSKNQVDSEHILAQVRDYYEIIPEGFEQDVDVLLLNTCGFIGDAKEESINTLLQMGELKDSGQVKALIAAGCLAQR